MPEYLGVSIWLGYRFTDSDYRGDRSHASLCIDILAQVHGSTTAKISPLLRMSAESKLHTRFEVGLAVRGCWQ